MAVVSSRDLAMKTVRIMAFLSYDNAIHEASYLPGASGTSDDGFRTVSGGSYSVKPSFQYQGHGSPDWTSSLKRRNFKSELVAVRC